ncbi:MAG: ABC transporter ATP-binding protein [Acidimicrobiales bacterium]
MGNGHTVEASLPLSRPVEAPPLLDVTDLTYAYASLQVLFGVSFQVGSGESVGLLGTNGAGKSTVLRAVVGLAKPSGGRVLLDGTNIAGEAAERVCRRSVALVVGGKAVFPDLTVFENLEVGAQLLDHRTASDRIARELERFPALRPLTGRIAGSLSGGEQQQLGIAKALLLDCRLLCIDELSLGLSPVVVDALLSTLRALHTDGVATLIVEQSLNVAAAICTRAVFLEKGAVRFEGPTAELAKRGDLARAVFLGATSATEARNGTARKR